MTLSNVNINIVTGTTEQKNKLLDSINQMMDVFKEDRMKTYLGGVRRYGKSQAAAMAAAMTVTNQAAGTKASALNVDEITDAIKRANTHFDTVIFDEWSGMKRGLMPRAMPKAEPEFVVDDPKWPGSRVEVWCKKIDKRDPRNPNPEAGAITRYEVHGEAMVINEPFHSMAMARHRAEELHKKTVKRIQAEMQKANPLFGRF